MASDPTVGANTVPRGSLGAPLTGMHLRCTRELERSLSSGYHQLFTVSLFERTANLRSAVDRRTHIQRSLPWYEHFLGGGQ